MFSSTGIFEPRNFRELYICTFNSEFDLPAATKHSSSGAFAKSTTLPFATLSLLTIEQCRNTKGKGKNIGLYSRNEAELSLF